MLLMWKIPIHNEYCFDYHQSFCLTSSGYCIQLDIQYKILGAYVIEMIGHIGNTYLILSGGPIQHVYYIKSIGHPLAHLKQYNVTILSMFLSHIWTEGAHFGEIGP